MEEECVNSFYIYIYIYFYLFIYIGSEWARRGFVMLWYVTVATPNSQPPKIFLAFLTLEVLQTRKVLVFGHALLTACGATLQSWPHFFLPCFTAAINVFFFFLFICVYGGSTFYERILYFPPVCAGEQHTLCMRMIHQWLNMLCILQLMFEFKEISVGGLSGLYKPLN